MDCQGDVVMGACGIFHLIFTVILLTRISFQASDEILTEEFFSSDALSKLQLKRNLDESLERFFKAENDWSAFKKETSLFDQIERDEKFFFQGYAKNGVKKVKKPSSKRVDTKEEVSQRGRYCNCYDVYCCCCSSITIWGKKMFKGMSRLFPGCMEMEYRASDFAIFMTLSVNGHIIITRVVSGRNPLPFCARTPYVPLVSFCIRLYDIHHNPAGLSLCARLEVTSMRTILFSVSFDCIKIDNHKMSFLMPPNATTFGVVNLHLGETDPYLSYQDWTKLHFPLPEFTSSPAPTVTAPTSRKHMLRWFFKR